MFSSTLNERLKEHIYKNLRENAEQNLPSLIKRIIKDIGEKDHEKVRDAVGVIKFMVKDKLPAKPKFYALILLKEMMETREKNLVEYFTKKMLNRLFYLAQFESKNKDDLSRGERCLKKYYSQDSKENKEYSLKFFILLLECWKHWDDMFGASHKKIKQKSEKLKQLFPLNDLYYNYLDKSYKQDSDININSPTPRLSNDKGKDRDREREHINMSRSYESHNHTLSESMYRSEEIQKKVLTFYQIREALFPVVKENDAEEIGDILHDLYHSLRTQLEVLQKHKAKVMQSQRYSEKFRVRFLKESEIANSIIDLFDRYYNGTINYTEFQKKISELEQEIQKKSLEKFSASGNREERGGNFGTMSSLNDSEPMESSRRTLRVPDHRTDPGSEKNMSKSTPAVQVKPKTLQVHQRQTSDDKYGSAYDRSTEIIREVKEEYEDDEENFDDNKWKDFSNFKAPAETGKNNQLGFDDGKRASAKFNSPDYNFEPKNSKDQEETDFNDFNDFNEKMVEHEFDNPNQMATIDEESRDDYESKLSMTRGPHDSRITSKGGKQLGKTESKENQTDIKFDDFNDFVFKQNSPTAKNNDWLNFGNQGSQHKSSRLLDTQKQEMSGNHKSVDWTNQSKELAGSFKKPGLESKSQRNVPRKSPPPIINTPPQPKNQKQFIPDVTVMSHHEEDTLQNFSAAIKNSSAKKDSAFKKNTSIMEKNERIVAYESHGGVDHNKSEITKRRSDDEFESFNHNQDISADADPFSQFKVVNNVSQDNSEINRNLESNMMTFGMQHFNNISDMHQRGTAANLQASDVAVTENEEDVRDVQEPLDENAFEFQFDTNEPQEIKEDFGFGFGDNFANPQFERSMEHNLLKIQDYGDDQPFSAYSNERRFVEIPAIKTQLQSPAKTKVVKMPTSLAKEIPVPNVEKFEPIKMEESPELAEKEIADLKTHKEHYRQQCDFLFSKLLALQKEQTKHRLNKTQDRSGDTLNVPEEDELDLYQNKIVNRRNDYLQKENQMLKRLNKDLVESNNALVDKKELENNLLKKLVSEMESYVSELQQTLSKFTRS